MDLATFSGAFQWIIAHGYFLMFIIMVVEGPVITAAAAFASALGYFNPFLVFLLSILGNLVPDVIYYAIGYWGRKRVVNKYGHYLGLSDERILYLEDLSEKHAGKALTLIKIVPFLATPGLIIAGAVRMKLKKYVWWSIALTIPSSLFFFIVGFYFGEAYNVIVQYLDYGGALLIILLILFALVYYGYRKVSEIFAKKIDKSYTKEFTLLNTPKASRHGRDSSG